MNKRAFIERLKARLRGLPQREVSERINFYIEMIDDRIEDGLSEEAAIDAVGDLDEIAAQIRESIAGKEAIPRTDSRKWRAWEIVVVALGSPLWLPLLIAGLVIVFSVLLVLWSINLVLWAVEAVFFIFAFASKYMIIAFKAVSSWSLCATKQTLNFIKRLFLAK